MSGENQQGVCVPNEKLYGRYGEVLWGDHLLPRR